VFVPGLIGSTSAGSAFLDCVCVPKSHILELGKIVIKRSNAHAKRDCLRREIAVVKITISGFEPREHVKNRVKIRAMNACPDNQFRKTVGDRLPLKFVKGRKYPDGFGNTKRQTDSP
jgi:hypothetical protein